jgi:hypothetical protein
MTCLQNIIGYKGNCSSVQSTSGLYVEDIGITASECDFIINKEYANGDEFLKDKIRLASELVSKTITNHFASYINPKTFIDGKTLGFYKDNLIYRAGDNDYRGIGISMTNEHSYLKIYINSLSLQTDYTGNVDVKVFNLITNKEIDSFTVPCVADEISTIQINKEYNVGKGRLDLIFVYDTTGIQGNTAMLDFVGCTSCNGYVYSNGYISSRGLSVGLNQDKLRMNTKNISHTAGMSINYSVQCAPEKWICELGNLISLPILYKLGMEVMNYAIYYSKRQTSNVNVDAEINKERLQMYTEEYNKALESSIKKINMPKGDVCFKCEEYIKSAIILP